MVWTSAEVRESYLKFFEGKDHLRLPSASLIPVNDPTLLLIGAGMAPFKAYFRGDEKPPHPRVTTCQKCVRADDAFVGVTARHFTFFEMLGNFSFGDYFKSDTCAWAWEYLTEQLGLAKERLWVTIHPDDDEASAVWTDEVGVPAERVGRLADNFWGPIGASGPCGPCSEIYYDQGPKVGCGQPDCKPGCDCDRYLEIWNLVFTGLNRDEHGHFSKLPRPCIDTGMGFERITALMQGKPSPYETDLFTAIMQVLHDLSGHTIADGEPFAKSLKVIADHTRAVTFMAADGVSPSNEGRGYVMRRMLRRAMRCGQVAGISGAFLEKVVPAVVATFGGVYPELKTRENHVAQILIQEQASFLRTLEHGTRLLQWRLEQLAAVEKGLQELRSGPRPEPAEPGKHVPAGGRDPLSGADVFELYDTFGFPVDLTREIAREHGVEIDEAGFERLLEEQRERSRADLKGKLDASRPGEIALAEEQPTSFLGYQTTSDRGRVQHILRDGAPVASAAAGDRVEILLDRTPFYAEGGGQVGDTGTLSRDGVVVAVTDTQKGAHDRIRHRAEIRQGTLQVGDEVDAVVDLPRREAIMRHHTATHLLQAALRRVVGSHVTQTGSLVAPDRLRFDFSHYAPLSLEQIEAVERLVNEQILRNTVVDKREMSMNEAMDLGALAFFGEKYADRVRVVLVDHFSRELCGGTHCAQTGDIGTFKIISESAIAAGQRRIEAVCGMVALEAFRTYEQTLRNLSQELKTNFASLPDALARLRDNLQQAERKLQDLGDALSQQRAGELIDSVQTVAGVSLLAAEVASVSAENLRKMADRVRDRLKSGVVLLSTRDGGKATLLCMVTPDLIQRGLHAGQLIAAVTPKVGGKGGGRPDMAQGGGANPDGIGQALDAARQIVAEKLAGR